MIVKRGLQALIATAALLGAVAGPASAQAVFINEIHYDNVGVDQDEGVNHQATDLYTSQLWPCYLTVRLLNRAHVW